MAFLLLFIGYSQTDKERHIDGQTRQYNNEKSVLKFTFIVIFEN